MKNQGVKKEFSITFRRFFIEKNINFALKYF